MKIVTIIDLPDHLAQTWLKYINEFNLKYGECEFKLFAHASDKTTEEIMEILNIPRAAGGRAK